MVNTNAIVLVTGATGRHGGAVIRHMLPKGWKLRALTRNPRSYAAQELARQGVEVVEGDLEDPPSLDRASRGVYGIYSVQDFWTVGARREVQQGKNLADVSFALANGANFAARREPQRARLIAQMAPVL